MLGTSGCLEADSDYGEHAEAFELAPQPADDVPAQLREGTWISRWDNPPMVGSYRLQEIEWTESDVGTAWYHSTYDLMARQHSPASSFDVFVVPESGAYSSGMTMKWSAHGSRLPPRVTGAPDEGRVNFRLRYNSYLPGTFIDYSDPASLQLNSNVVLVPIHVIQLYVKGADLDGDGWYSKSRADATFDDYWLAYDHIYDAPPFYPYDVTHIWGEKPGSSNLMQHAQPDLIWTQCDIQFRVVEYTACPVDKDTFRNNEHCTTGFPCGGELTHPQASKVINAVNDCEEANGKPGKPVIMTGSLDNLGCECYEETLGIAEPVNWAIVSKESLATANGGTLAHELGHLLGIKYHTPNAADLMYEKHISGSPHLVGANECAAARSYARQFQNEVWPPP